MKKPVIKTTVIGSYPAKPDNMAFMRNYFDQTLDNSWEKNIETAVNDMLGAGIDIITDGQTRDPMIQLFTRKFNGCRIRGRAEVINKIGYGESVTVEDQKYVRSLLPKDRKLKGVITGPYTLAKSCVDLYYNDEKQEAFDFASALKQEAELLQKHVDIISMDEPFFSDSVPEYGKNLIKLVTQNISLPTALHVCGDTSKSISNLIEMPVDILCLEFKGSPNLFDELKDYSFPQKICLGSVRSDSSRIESTEEIVEHIKKAISIFGDKIVQISPDCGQRPLSREVAYQKLRNLVKAGEIINGQ